MAGVVRTAATALRGGLVEFHWSLDGEAVDERRTVLVQQEGGSDHGTDEGPQPVKAVHRLQIGTYDHEIVREFESNGPIQKCLEKKMTHTLVQSGEFKNGPWSFNLIPSGG